MAVVERTMSWVVLAAVAAAALREQKPPEHGETAEKLAPRRSLMMLCW